MLHKHYMLVNEFKYAVQNMSQTHYKVVICAAENRQRDMSVDTMRRDESDCW